MMQSLISQLVSLLHKDYIYNLMSKGKQINNADLRGIVMIMLQLLKQTSIMNGKEVKK